MQKHISQNKWNYGQRRFTDIAVEHTGERLVRELLMFSNVKIEAEYVEAMLWGDEDRVERKKPSGACWEDYIPLRLQGREYRVAHNYANPEAFFVPEWPFGERLDYYQRVGASRQVARDCARNGVRQAAVDYLNNDISEVHVRLEIDGTEYLDVYNRIGANKYIDTEDTESVLKFLFQTEGLQWIIDRVRTEQAELAAGQVGATYLTW